MGPTGFVIHFEIAVCMLYLVLSSSLWLFVKMDKNPFWYKTIEEFPASHVVFVMCRSERYFRQGSDYNIVEEALIMRKAAIYAQEQDGTQ